MSGSNSMWSELSVLSSGSVLLRNAHTRPSLSVARDIPRDNLRPVKKGT